MVAEELIHFIWQFRLFNQLELYSTDDEHIKVDQVGQCNKDAGPDFLFSRVSIGGQVWHGHIEIHVNGADWAAHGHQTDPAYNSVVLHVVYQHPIPVFREDGTRVPCLELKPLIHQHVLEDYQGIMQNLHWIPCEKLLPGVDDLHKVQLMQRMAVARMEQRNVEISKLLDETATDWEKVLFVTLCRSFGMKVNAEPFMELGKRVDLALVRKYRADPLKVEAMLFGQAGFLRDASGDGYVSELVKEYRYLKALHRLQERRALEWKFMRMRPYNFPTFRLAQLLALYRQRPYLFEEVLACKELDDLKRLLAGGILHPFWEVHFTLGKTSPAHGTELAPAFVEHLIINALIPILFSYGKNMGDTRCQSDAMDWLGQLKAEQNNITRKFRSLSCSASSAADSQGLLQLKQDYCDRKRCLQCSIGWTFFKR